MSIEWRPEADKCRCSGDRSFRYHTDFRGRTTLHCKQCGKPEADSEINFGWDKSVVDAEIYVSKSGMPK